MALPVGVQKLGTFKGSKGDTGTLAFATAEPIPADAEPEVEMIGPESNRGAHFKIPRGLPGTNGVETDEAVSVYVDAPDSETRGAVNTAIRVEAAAEVATVATPLRNEIVELVASISAATDAKRAAISGGSQVNITHLMYDPDAATLALNACTKSTDLVHYSVNGKGIKLTTAGAVSAWCRMLPMLPVSPLPHPPASAVGIWVWIPDASKITSLQVELGNNPGTWTRTSLDARLDAQPSATGLVNGLNLLRWNAVSGSIGSWLEFASVRVVFGTNAATDITIQSVFYETPVRNKAQIVFINDGNFRNYENYFGKRMRARGFPTQWAIGCSTAEKATLTGPNLTVPELLELQALGDMVSFHNYDTLNLFGGGQQIMSTASPAQVLLWTQQAQAWLKAHGFRGWYVRSAWLQNDAPAAPTSGAWDILAAAPTHVGRTALQAWPLQSPKAYPRITYQGMTPAALDTHFANLKATRQLGVFYTHDVKNTGGSDMTEAQADYFIQKVDQGIAEGWLEGVTMETLFMRNGARYIDDPNGAPKFIYQDEYGVTRILG